MENQIGITVKYCTIIENIANKFHLNELNEKYVVTTGRMHILERECSKLKYDQFDLIERSELDCAYR
jgi:hypothetical protein